MKLKTLSRILAFGILLNGMPINSFAGILSEDGKYETFAGNNITINDVLEEEKLNIKTEGKTLVNYYDYNALWKENDVIIDISTKEVIFGNNIDESTNLSYTDSALLLKPSLDLSKTYTIVMNVVENTYTGKQFFTILDDYGSFLSNEHYRLPSGQTGLVKLKFTAKENSDGRFKIYLRNPKEQEDRGIVKVKDIMILEGDWTNTQPPNYFEGIQSSFENNLVTQETIDSGEEKAENLGKYKVEIKSTGKNKFNGKFEVGSIGPDGNDLESDTAYRSVDYIDVKNINSLLSNYNLNYFWYDSNKNLIGEVLYGVKSGTIVKKPYGAKYLRIYRGSLVSDLQLEESSVVTEYEPYKESINTFYLNSPLLEGDTIEVVDGQAYHIKKRDKITFDGSDDEGWYKAQEDGAELSNTALFRIHINNYGNYCISDRFISGTTGDTERVGAYTGAVAIRINKSKMSEVNVAGFREWLSKNPTTMIYNLDKPIYEPINADLSVQLFEGTTHILNNSNIPVEMEIIVDRVLNRAIEAIEIAKINPTVSNISKARMWINLLDDSIKKDELQDKINSITDIEDLQLERKTITSNIDIYVKSQNTLLMSVSTNSITFDDFSGVEDMIKENAINISINSSLPYNLNAYLATEIQNSDGANIMDKDILAIKESSELDYQTFSGVNNKLILKENCESGNNQKHNVDLKLNGGIAHEKDVYKTVIKFEVEQK